ncbi:MAG: SixA phosphatase family protein [Chitinophagaceae bacterium]
MKYLLYLLLAGLTACSNTIYIVRHAEKQPVKAGASAMEAGNPPLSEAGEARAAVLRDLLKGKHIARVFSTNYTRTIRTAEPLREWDPGLVIEIYSSKKDSLDVFVEKLKSIRKGNVLVVGHSNTIGEITNRLCGRNVVPASLAETQYDNLYEVRRKGIRYLFHGKKFGARTE